VQRGYTARRAAQRTSPLPDVLIINVSGHCMTQHVSLFHAARRGRRPARSSAGTATPSLFKLRRRHMQSFLLLVSVVSALLVFSAQTHPANSSTALSASVQYLQASYKGHVQSAYGVSGGFWKLEVNYTSPTVTLLGRTRYHRGNKTCWQLASAHPEAFSQLYHPTRKAPTVRECACFATSTTLYTH
jgi:hypothetical protein